MKLPFIDAQPLYEYLAVLDKPFPCEPAVDVIFVLGSGSIGPARRASRLYHEGLAKYVAFMSSGGNFGGNIVFGREEVDAYGQALMGWEVPREALLFPIDKLRRTTNTKDEARGAIPFIESAIGVVTRVGLCSRSVHQRRAWATFRKQHPKVHYVNYPDNEELTVEILPRMVQEIDRLREYGAKGDLEIQEIPQEVSDICEALRAHLKR